MESSKNMRVKSTCGPLPERALRSGWSFLSPGRRFMSKGSILVVDDEVEIREGLDLLLSSEDFRVTLAPNAKVGLEHLEHSPYDLVLLDVSLPDRNGIELLREIR